MVSPRRLIWKASVSQSNLAEQNSIHVRDRWQLLQLHINFKLEPLLLHHDESHWSNMWRTTEWLLYSTNGISAEEPKRFDAPQQSLSRWVCVTVVFETLLRELRWTDDWRHFKIKVHPNYSMLTIRQNEYITLFICVN